MNETIILKANGGRHLFYRVESRWFGGVCAGLTHSFDINPQYLVRLLWAISLFLSLGTSVVIYLIMWSVLPKETQLEDYQRPKLLGVCNDIAKETGLELALVRLLAVASIFLSLGLTLLVYFGLWIFFSLRD